MAVYVVTGGAGFIGSHIAEALVPVVRDNLNEPNAVIAPTIAPSAALVNASFRYRFAARPTPGLPRQPADSAV